MTGADGTFQPSLSALWDKEWEKHLLEAARTRVRKQVSDAQYQLFDLLVEVMPGEVPPAAGTQGKDATPGSARRHRPERNA
jgi:hypothetical protein